MYRNVTETYQKYEETPFYDKGVVRTSTVCSDLQFYFKCCLMKNRRIIMTDTAVFLV